MESFASFVPPAYLILVLAIVFAASLNYLRSRLDWKTRAQGLPLPPGPQPLPIVGNVFGLPTIRPWLGFRDMSKEYGDLIYLRVFGKGLLLIGSAELAHEFLDKRSANTSDRAVSPAIKLSGQDLNFGIFPYGPRWRLHRREFWQFFYPGVVTKYRPIQLAETQKFLGRVLTSPSRLKVHIKYLFTGAILKVVYGIDIVDEDDPRIAIPHAALEAIRRTTPGGFAVEAFPILRYVPSWFTGAGFQKIFAECKTESDHMKHVLFDEAKEALGRGDSRPCVVAEMLRRAQPKTTESNSSNLPEETEDKLKNVCATTVEGGADMTYSLLQAVFVAMTLYPDVQHKAQAALDAVVGPDRLPDFGDSDALPYIHAIVRETLRWHVVAPLGVPHRTMRDDEFHGYFIPAGTNVFPNAWCVPFVSRVHEVHYPRDVDRAMLHDPVAYPDPDEFRPERFMRDGQLDLTVTHDPALFAFGFGRRICAGRYFAFSSLFITVASVLHVFDIGPPLDTDGAPIPIKFQQTPELLSYPEDCRCTVKPRSKAAEALIVAGQELND